MVSIYILSTKNQALSQWPGINNYSENAFSGTDLFGKKMIGLMCVGV